VFEIKEEAEIKVKFMPESKTMKITSKPEVEPCRIRKITESQSFKVFANNSKEKENTKSKSLAHESKITVSFSRELQDSPNKLPDKVTRTKPNVIKKDLIADNVNLREIKIDIDNSFTIVKTS
jgi:hypothetical protein